MTLQRYQLLLKYMYLLKLEPTEITLDPNETLLAGSLVGGRNTGVGRNSSPPLR